MSKTKVWEKKSFWLFLLGFLCVVIVGLAVGIWLNNIKPNKENQVVLVDKMEGWDGPISEDTQASVFSWDVNEKLENDKNYTVDDAIFDYKNAYNTSSGNLRFFVAIKYAYFMINTHNDLDEAISIMQGVEDLINLDYNNEIYYYNTLYNLCIKAGDEEKSLRYKEALDDAISGLEKFE